MEEEIRKRCIDEIITTEESYVEAMYTLVQHYLKPLKELAILSDKEILSIFSNIEIIANLNTELLKQLEERKVIWVDEEPSIIGDIFVRMGPMFRMYREYCQNFDNSLETLKFCTTNEKWMEYLQYVNHTLLNKKNASQQSTQFNLSSFLIMPVQRIPRYSMLLSELCKLTPPDHPDFENLNKAKNLIKEIATSLNEFIKDVEHRNKVLVIQNLLIGLKMSLLEPHRIFVKQGQLKKITSRMIQTCYLFLFSDILVYSHRQILSNYQYNGTIELGTAWVRNLEDTEKVKKCISISWEKENLDILCRKC